MLVGWNGYIEVAWVGSNAVYHASFSPEITAKNACGCAVVVYDFGDVL